MIKSSFNFESDLQNDGRELLKGLLHQHFSSVSNGREYKIIDVSGDKIPNKDFVLEFQDTKMQVAIETKFDKYPSTGNMIIELIASCDEEYFKQALPSGRSKRYVAGQADHEFVANTVLENKWYGRPGLGLSSGLTDNHLLFYVFYDKNKRKVVRKILAKSLEVRNYIIQSLKNKAHDLVITRTNSSLTGRNWITVSSVIPINILKDQIVLKIEEF